MKKHIIFDFDGVIADSFGSFYPMIKDAMTSIGISISQKQYRNLFLGNIHQGFRNFIKNDRKFAKFAEYRTEHYSDYYRPAVFPGAYDFIKKLAARKYKMAIASSGHRNTVLKTLKINKMGKFFDMILATDEFSKKAMIEKIMTTLGFEPKNSVMITDTVGDIRVAKSLGLKTIAITWGFQSAKDLRSSGTDYLVDNFKQLFETLDQSFFDRDSIGWLKLKAF